MKKEELLEDIKKKNLLECLNQAVEDLFNPSVTNIDYLYWKHLGAQGVKVLASALC